MVDVDLVINGITFYAEIAAIVSHDDLISNPTPFGRMVKTLVQVPVVSESIFTNFTIQLQVFKPLDKCLEFGQLCVCPKISATHPDHRNRYNAA